jgi:hypothetical protein
MVTHVLSLALFAIRCTAHIPLPVLSLLINVSQRNRIIIEIRLSQRPTVRQAQSLQLSSHLLEALIYRLNLLTEINRIPSSLDFMSNIEAIFDQGGANGLRGWDVRCPWTDAELPIDSGMINLAEFVDEFLKFGFGWVLSCCQGRELTTHGDKTLM